MSAVRRMKRGGNDEPETRVGICCGEACRAAQKKADTWGYALLFKVLGFYRYRCSYCFRAETGKRHYLDSLELVPMCPVCSEPYPAHTLACPLDG